MARRRGREGGAEEGPEPLRRKDLLLFFFLPVLGIIALIFLVSTINRASIRTGAERLAREQMVAAAEILKAGIAHSIKEGAPPSGILDLYSGDENIYFMALLDGTKSILGWRSKFEGYLPLSVHDIPPEGTWIIESPAGRIFNVFEEIPSTGATPYYLYLGYSLNALDKMIARAGRNSTLVFGVIAALGIVLIRGIFLLQSNYLAREKEAEEERIEKQRYREISAFTSGIAHEIKNPLNGLHLALDLLEAGTGPGMREKASLGKEEVRKISLIIDRFSDALRPLDPRPETFSLRQAVDSALDSLASEYPPARTGTRVEIDRGLLVRADKPLLSLALSNILRNAYEAAAEEVVVEGGRTRKGVEIAIRDSGPGIPPDRLEKIFEPFFTTKPQGKGIGLYLTRKIVEAHGGAIEVQGAGPSGGTVFRIRIPGG
jgi:signal transduction histidine kinase